MVFQLVEEGGIEDDAVLDHLGQAAPQLAYRQRIQVGVDPDAGGLVEVADDVLGLRMVHTDLAADRAIDLGQRARSGS